MKFEKMFVNFFILVLFPTLILSQKCPTFEFVVQLNSSAIAHNFSFAIIADGKYYLVESQDPNNRLLEPTGDMPKGFDGSHATVLMDSLHCNDSKYFLLSLNTKIRKEEKEEENQVTFYSTLDLLNWNQTTRWSEPKPISEYPMLANDPYIQLIPILEPNLVLSNIIRTMFYWPEMRTIFVVVELSQNLQLSSKDSTFRYYTIDMKNTCEEDYSYSKLEDLGSALTSVIEPLDSCFISGQKESSDALLYCIGGHYFQVNAITSQFSKNIAIQTKSVTFPYSMPKVDQLPVLAQICKPSLVINLRVYDKSDNKSDHKSDHKSDDSKAIPQKMSENRDLDLVMRKMAVNPQKGKVTEESKTKDQTSTYFLIAVITFVCVALLILLVVIIVTICKTSSIARM